MTVWHIVTSEYPPDVGGVSDYTRQVAEGLSRAGDEVHVWCPRPAQDASVPRVHVHPELGRIRPGDLRRMSARLDAFPAPRRLLIQWVPHGFGYHSMNVWFCLWVAGRALTGDLVELMVHEAYSEFRRGPLRHVVMGCVQRLMTMLLMCSTRRVWVATPAWERRLRAYALGRRLSITWLPVPGCVPSRPDEGRESGRRGDAGLGIPLIGHFGSFGTDITALLDERLPQIMAHRRHPTLLLLGANGEAYRDRLVGTYPQWSLRVHATGFMPVSALAEKISACDLFLQPYPDGITSRRTTTMACLSQGRPVVTTHGHLTESLWANTGAVAMAGVADVDQFVSEVTNLLDDPERARALGDRGQRLYLDAFDVTRLVNTLKAA